MTTRPIAPAAEWYRVRRLDHDITHVDEHFIDPFYRCNVWHVRGRDHDLLVDSGMGVVSLVGQLPWLSGRRVLAVASHAYFDHVGNHHEFPERACHPAKAHMLADPRNDWNLANRFAVVEMFERLPPGNYDQRTYHVRPAPPTRLVEAGDVIDLGDWVFEVLHVPGHHVDPRLRRAPRRVALANPDFVRLGEAFGVNAARVPPEGGGRAVREARERGGVWLIEVPFAPAGSVNMAPWMP